MDHARCLLRCFVPLGILFSKGKRWPVVKQPPGKTRITIRIEDDVLEWSRAQAHAAGGGNYQTMMNQALREFAEYGSRTRDRS